MGQAAAHQLESRNPVPHLRREGSDHPHILSSLTVTSLKGTSRNGAAEGWVKLYIITLQRLKGKRALGPEQWGLLVFAHILGEGGCTRSLGSGLLPRRPRRGSTWEARAVVRSTGLWCLCSSISHTRLLQPAKQVSELVPVPTTSRQKHKENHQIFKRFLKTVNHEKLPSCPSH